MTDLVVTPAEGLSGEVWAPGDKSISHRALIFGGLAVGQSTVRGISSGDDVLRTAAAMEAFGATITQTSDGLVVTGVDGRISAADRQLDLGNSGTGMRLLSGVAAGVVGETVLDGDDSLRRRPMDRVAVPLEEMGASITGAGDHAVPPLHIRGGGFHGIAYESPVASAQVKGAILLAGLFADGETSVIEPVRTRTHTEDFLALTKASFSVDEDARRVAVERSSLAPFTIDVAVDPSQAAFWIVAALIVPNAELTVRNVYVGFGRGGFIDVLRQMGASIDMQPVSESTADITARSSALEAVDIGGDVSGFIDEIPILAVAAACARGVTTFADAGELRVKESDRIASTARLLRAFGSGVEERDDGLVVEGRSTLTGTAIDSQGDHRIAMAGAIAALRAAGSSTIAGWEAVGTSYPGFERELERCRS